MSIAARCDRFKTFWLPSYCSHFPALGLAHRPSLLQFTHLHLVMCKLHRVVWLHKLLSRQRWCVCTDPNNGLWDWFAPVSTWGECCRRLVHMGIVKSRYNGWTHSLETVPKINSQYISCCHQLNKVKKETKEKRLYFFTGEAAECKSGSVISTTVLRELPELSLHLDVYIFLYIFSRHSACQSVRPLYLHSLSL